VTVTVKSVPIIREFKATPSAFYQREGPVNATLNWIVENADSVRLTNYGVVGQIGSITVTLSATTSYRLTACNVAGECVSEDVTITVKNVPVIVEFRAIPEVISKGSSAMLKWKVANADRVMLTNLGEVEAESSRMVAPLGTAIYTLTACKVTGDCVNANVIVTVREKPSITGFTASANSITLGQCVDLTWTVENAVSIMLRDQTRGTTVDVTGFPGYRACPTATTTLTLVACNASGECVQSAQPITVIQPTQQR
jgi:hypothetical protein